MYTATLTEMETIKDGVPTRILTNVPSRSNGDKFLSNTLEDLKEAMSTKFPEPDYVISCGRFDRVLVRRYYEEKESICAEHRSYIVREVREVSREEILRAWYLRNVNNEVGSDA